MVDLAVTPEAGNAGTARSPAGIVACCLAALCSLAATAGLIAGQDLRLVAMAMLLHTLAVLLVARGTQAARASKSEVVLFATAAAALPSIGALSALWFCASRAPRHASNAHAENDPVLAIGARTNTDLQRELGVNSYTQVVRHGSLEEKRNLLRRLAQLGTPRHLSIVRQFLFENEPELRLCAYAELARIGQRHEERIGGLRRAAEAPERELPLAEALTELAAANRAYAISGVLDEEMARYWSERAESIARQALAADPTCRPAQRVLALVLGDRGFVDEAWQIMADWPAELDMDNELARAEIAFRRRDRTTCRAALARLLAIGEQAPEWLRTIANAAVTT